MSTMRIASFNRNNRALKIRQSNSQDTVILRNLHIDEAYLPVPVRMQTGKKDIQKRKWKNIKLYEMLCLVYPEEFWQKNKNQY